MHERRGVLDIIPRITCFHLYVTRRRKREGLLDGHIQKRWDSADVKPFLRVLNVERLDAMPGVVQVPQKALKFGDVPRFTLRWRGGW